MVAQAPDHRRARTILVTGAGSGIGYATAALFAARGWRVFAGHLADQPVPPQTIGLLLDVTDAKQIASAFAAIGHGGGGLDAVVNNAALNPAGSVEGLGASAFRRILEVNIVGAIAVTAAALPAMREAGLGTIVNVGSGMSRTVIPFSAAYATSKFALEGFSRALWYEAAPLGIAVRHVLLGAHNTGFGVAHPDLAREPAVYHARLARMARFAARTLGRAAPAELAAAGIWRAVHARSGRLYYTIGSDAVVARLLGTLPFALVGAGLARAFADTRADRRHIDDQ